MASNTFPTKIKTLKLLNILQICMKRKAQKLWEGAGRGYFICWAKSPSVNPEMRTCGVGLYDLCYQEPKTSVGQ